MADPIFLTPYAALARFDTSKDNDPVILRITQAYREAPAGKCPYCGKPSAMDSKFCSELCCAKWWREIEHNAMPGKVR